MKILQGNIITGPPIVVGDITWDAGNFFNSTADFSMSSVTDFNVTSGTGNINFLSITGQVNLVSDLDCTFGSVSGSFFLTANSQQVFTATTGDIDLTATAADVSINAGGSILLNQQTKLALNKLYFGSSNQADIFFDTGLVINPKVSGSGILTLGSATGTADGDIIINKMGIGNSAISANAYVNAVITGSGRGILNFDLTFTGAGNSAAVVAAYLTDQGTNANYTGICYHAQPKGDAHTHSGNTTYYGFYTQGGLTANFNVSAGTHTTYGLNASIDAFGTGSGSITGGTFRRYGVFIPAMSNISGTPTSDLQMGVYSAESINVNNNTKIIFDSTSTAEGDTSMAYISASSLLRTIVDATTTWESSTTTNQSLIDLTIADAKNIILGSTTGTKIGTATTQKLGFFNKTPVVQPAAYTPTNASSDRSYDCNATSIDELADVLATLISDLQSLGLIG